LRWSQRRVYILVLLDVFLVNLALGLAMWLRFEGAVPPKVIDGALRLAIPFTVVRISCFYAFGLYNRLWQYASTGEILSIVRAVTLGSLLNVSLAYFLMERDGFPLPRSVFVFAWLLEVFFVGGIRFCWRLYRDYVLKTTVLLEGKPVLIVGAGDAGVAVAREMKNHFGQHRQPVGFVDDDPQKQGMQLMGLRVLGGRDDIPRLVYDCAVEEIIIAMPSVSGRVVRELVEICQSTGVRLKTLPGMYELIDGKVTLNQIRDVHVEDILGRDPVQVDLESIAGYLAGKVVLITGAGGSIGSELCRQVARFAPVKLILLEYSENNVYDIHQELEDINDKLDMVPVVADIKDATAIDEVFRKYRPQVIFHAAAHKHVPLMETNPAEALNNNILGSWCVARIAHKYRAEAFILISTDKAVNPTSIMGASKRVAEMVVQEISCTSQTRFAAVRFGNVIDSKGSVVPLFRKQIARGGPVTVTHAEMIRYFMTIPEAAQLVIQAGAMACGGEVFTLDMGEPVKIVDLARSMIRLSGFEPDEDIKIVYSGIRSGEKLYEELFTAEEEVSATRHQRIYVGKLKGVDTAALEALLIKLRQPGWYADKEEVIASLRSLIPAFRVDKQELWGVSETVRDAVKSALQEKPTREARGLLVSDEKPQLAQSG